MRIRFTRHAEEKFAVLRRHGFAIAKQLVVGTVRNPEWIDSTRLPLLIAQRSLTVDHVLRVVYREERDSIVIITFYPGRTSQYENKKIS